MSKELKKEINQEAVGKAFEDMEVTEMAEVQGAGDVDAETTPVIVTTAGAAYATYKASVYVTKTVKGHC